MASNTTRAAGRGDQEPLKLYKFLLARNSNTATYVKPVEEVMTTKLNQHKYNENNHTHDYTHNYRIKHNDEDHREQ